MKTICVIPARMGSSRFPNKPLTPILGMPMLGHVALRCRLSTQVEKVVVATCDEEIVKYCNSIGVQAVMTSDQHERASDRVQEAVQILERDNSEYYEVVLMVQGDEPMVTPKMLDTALNALKSTHADVVNLMSVIEDEEEWTSANCVKVVTSLSGKALYFSREAIPSRRKFKGTPRAYKQVCIIPFTRKFLDTYSSLAPTYLEEVESVDMNRILENDLSVHCAEISEKSYPVDVPEDVLRVERELRHCQLLPTYFHQGAN